MVKTSDMEVVVVVVVVAVPVAATVRLDRPFLSVARRRDRLLLRLIGARWPNLQA